MTREINAASGGTMQRNLFGILAAAVCAALLACGTGPSATQDQQTGTAQAASSTGRSGVMMQGFYWDNPGPWYPTMQNNAPALANMAGGFGIDVMWFPPPSKATSGYSMGYDPYDYWDVGQYNQMGTTSTKFGSQAQLKSAIYAYTSRGIAAMADIVLNHRSGGASEANPKTGGNTWTNFGGVLSGMGKWHWDSFHPNNYEWSDEGTFGGYPDVAYTSGSAYNDIKSWMNWLKSTSNAGFSQWRFDYVKGYHAWVVKDMKAATGNPFTVGEYWDTNMGTLDWWVGAANSSVFDFPLLYTVADIANNTGGGGYLPNLIDSSKSYAARNSGRSVPFCGNHDTDPITNDKMLCYAFTLTYQGYPMIWWKDYYNYGLSNSGGQWGNGIKQLVWVRGKLGMAAPNIQLLKTNDGDQLIYGSYGYGTGSPGYIVIINDNANSWLGSWVQTGNGYLKNKTLTAYAWGSTKSGQNYQPGSQWCDGNGWVQVWAPPRGYAVYSVSGL